MLAVWMSLIFSCLVKTNIPYNMCDFCMYVLVCFTQMLMFMKDFIMDVGLEVLNVCTDVLSHDFDGIG